MIISVIALDQVQHAYIDGQSLLKYKAKLIRKIICTCNEDPLTHNFYIVKLGFIGVYFIFLFLL